MLSLAGERTVEKAYWLRRKRASLKMARKATGPEARLIHYDLAGRYSLNAMAAGSPPIDLPERPPIKPAPKDGRDA